MLNNQPKVMLETISETETQAIHARYQRRNQNERSALYNPLLTHVMLEDQARERALIRLLKQHNTVALSDLKVLEIGCGWGGNLAQLIKLGAQAKNLMGVELLSERANYAREQLPAATQIVCADATTLNLPDECIDVVYQSTVFTSILDDAFQEKLAQSMWRLVKPGGAVLWYDFTFNNPSNPDVRGVKQKRIAALFPHAVIHTYRVTLAPPLARKITALSPALYAPLAALPFLRTHVFAWIHKPHSSLARI